MKKTENRPLLPALTLSDCRDFNYPESQSTTGY